MRKYIYLLVLPLLFASKSSQAQFAMAKDTAYGAAYAYFELGNYITNHKNDTSRISWRIIYHNMPQTWKDNASFGLCDNVTCYGTPILNGSTQTTDTIGAHKQGLFKVQFDVSSTGVPPTTSGPIYITTELTDGIQTDTVTFAINKWLTNVAKLNADNKADVAIYPNPVRDELNVIFDKAANITNVSIYNLVGKQLMSYKVNGSSAKLDVDKLPSGIYLLRATDSTGNVAYTRRFTHQ